MSLARGLVWSLLFCSSLWTTPEIPEVELPKEIEKRTVHLVSLKSSAADPKIGDEVTLTAVIRNDLMRTALLEVRLHLPGHIEVLAPDAEQICFVEPNSTKEIKWRTKLADDGHLMATLGFDVISEGRPDLSRTAKTPVSAATAAALGDVWIGTWTSATSGASYDAEMILRLDPSGAVEGRINWTIRRSPEKPEMLKEYYDQRIGASGVEYVWGGVDPQTGSLTLEGYRRDDPHRILGLDKYRLKLSEDMTKLEGVTSNHGTWKAKITLDRKPSEK
ncbi:MAG: hypothetical protein JSS02_07905 [Planctomycetes bacterium]|nr:hypothetical protein [Planctomycetota bacterium]